MECHGSEKRLPEGGSVMSITLCLAFFRCMFGVIFHDTRDIFNDDDSSHTEGVYVEQPSTTPYPSRSNGLSCIFCTYD